MANRSRVVARVQKAQERGNDTAVLAIVWELLDEIEALNRTRATDATDRTAKNSRNGV